MQDPDIGREDESSTSGCGWVTTMAAICLLVLVIAFGLCAGFCGVNCLKR